VPGERQQEERPLSGVEKRVLALLGMPTFGLALSITAVTTYVPLARAAVHRRRPR
jgi:hypothetical protein